ncbi:MAG: AMP-binding protein, partial [Cellvibrionaceae bacterium]|nr:AMP-binding protein [Cellvibrionaceae bacterium]
MNTVFTAVEAAIARFAERPFLHIPALATGAYGGQPVDLSYAQLGEAVAAWRARYAAAGYGRGHRVALLLENRQQFFSHWFALNSLGASVVPINGDMQEDEIRYLLSDSEAVLGVALTERLAQLHKAGDGMAVMAESEPGSLPQAPSPAQVQSGDTDTECALLYTSGSTGKPKGCILSNEYFLEFGRWYQTVGGLIQLEPGRERLLTPLPLVHMNAMAVSTMGMVLSGGCLIQLDRFSPSTWWQAVAESGATIVHYLGVLPAILLNVEAGPHERKLAVKFGFGAGVNPRHHQRFEQRFGFPLIESWAMTESGSGGCITA